MFDLIQELIYKILKIQSKILKQSTQDESGFIFQNHDSKTVFTNGASLELNSKTTTKKAKAKNNIEEIIKNCNGNSKELIKFIEKNGTRVYDSKFSAKITKLIGVEDGFITSLSGRKALFLSFCLFVFGKGKSIKLNTEPLFLIESKNPENCTFIQQFYKWYSMKFNLPGFDEKAQENFQKILQTDNINVKGLSIQEIIGLKEAIARDVEAINFAVELAKNTDGSKKAMKKITAGGASV